MERDVPEKKIPSTAAKATRRSANVDWSSEIHLSAQSAFILMQGTVQKRRISTRARKEEKKADALVSIAWKSMSRWAGSRM